MFGVNDQSRQDRAKAVTHEPLISLATYDKVQERRNGAARAPKRKNIGDAFALRGIVVCDGCDVTLRSSFARGKLGKRYPYYLCQTKDCDHYGKSIKRDKVEGDVGEFIKQLEPDHDVVRMLTDMFRMIWDARREQAKSILRAGKRQVTQIDKEIDKLLDLIMASRNITAIQKYEEKIAEHEGAKARLAENLAKQAEPKGTFEEKLEPAISFLASPWKLWETPGKAQVHLRRLVLKLAFKTQLKYCRIEGARTPEIALPFKALAGVEGPKLGYGAGGGTRTHTGIRPSDFKSDMSTIPSRPHLAPSSKLQIPDGLGPENRLFVTTPCFVYALLHTAKVFMPSAHNIPTRANSGHRVLLCVHDKTRRPKPPCGFNQLHSCPYSQSGIRLGLRFRMPSKNIFRRRSNRLMGSKQDLRRAPNVPRERCRAEGLECTGI